MIFYACPACGHENEVHFEADGFDVADLWIDNEDNGMACAGCNQELSKDALYEAASLHAVGE